MRKLIIIASALAFIAYAAPTIAGPHGHGPPSGPPPHGDHGGPGEPKPPHEPHGPNVPYN